MSDKIELKIKRLHDDAVMPKYATDGSACFDLCAVYDKLCSAAVYAIAPCESMVFRTGLAFEVPNGYVLQVFSRSGHGFKNGVRLSNCTGIIDSDYRGELQIKLQNDGVDYFGVRHGDRIAQAMLVKIPDVQFIEVDDLSDTDRGTGGFGSTGA